MSRYFLSEIKVLLVGLHLLQERSTLCQQFAHALLFRRASGGVKPMLSARYTAGQAYRAGVPISTGAELR